MAVPVPSTGVRRIAVVAHSAHALTRFRGGLMRELVRRRHVVSAFAPEIDNATRTALAADGIGVVDLALDPAGASPFADRRGTRALAERLRELNPHVVIASGSRTAAMGVEAGRDAGAGMVVLIVNGLSALGLDDGRERRSWLTARGSTRRAKSAVEAAHLVVLHNEADRLGLVGVGVMPASHPVLVTAGSGVDLARYSEAPLPALSDGLVFLMAARLSKACGADMYVAAAKALRTKAPNAKFLLAGPEDSGGGRLTVQHLMSSGVVEYLGFLDDVRPAIARAHVIVHPSASEGLPGVVLEAMSMGRPVVTSNTPACRQTIDERVNGCLVAPRDAGQLTAAMESFLKRPDLIPAMARASRLKAERRFDERAVVAQLLGAIGLAD